MGEGVRGENGFWEENSALVRDWSIWELRKVRRAVLRAEWFCLEAQAMRGWRRMPSMYGDRTARTSARVGGLVNWGAGVSWAGEWAGVGK